MKRGVGPDLYSYLSFRDFLGDWFAARKAADSRFSHRLFARRAGVASPSLLNEVIAGRRNLTARTLEGFVAALGLDAEGAAFFAALVQLDQAKTDDDRNDAMQRVQSSRRFRAARPIEGASFRVVSNWYYAAILQLALTEGFRAEPTWIARQIRPAITASQAREALDSLFEVGLLARRDDGAVEVVEVSLATPHQVEGLAVHNYHAQMLECARSAITGFDPAERHLLGVTVAIPESLVPQLKRELDQVQERLLHLCDDAVDRADRVYQLELCLVPLSQRIPS